MLYTLQVQVREVPYWIDDSTLSQSITQSGASTLLENTTNATNNTSRQKSYFESLLPHDKAGNAKVKAQEGG